MCCSSACHGYFWFWSARADMRVNVVLGAVERRKIDRGEYPHASQGLRTFTPSPAKSLTLRVTSVKSCSRAVAAMTPSMLGSGFPLSNAWAERIPHLSAIALVTGRRRSSNHCSRSRSSHSSNCVRRFPGACRSIPLRISPKLNREETAR
jgi:hypothetical protein